jgi:predicted nucleotidyltransferase
MHVGETSPPASDWPAPATSGVYDPAAMDGATEQLRAIARRVVDEALALAPLRGALLAGSAGRGDADEWSDIDLLLYVDELPPEGTLELIRESVDGDDACAREARTPDFDGLDFAAAGALVQLLYARVSAIDDRQRRRLVELEELEEPWQKAALGLLEGLVLHDDGTIARWRERLRDFPEPLRRALIELHWRDLFPLWHYQEQIAARDAELWRLEMLIDAALRLLGVLAALNRVYYSRFQVKRLRKLAASFALTPPRLADRLESLLQLAPSAAAEELGQLVLETRQLVLRELPDLELPLRFPPGTRQKPMRL